jgi:hypothetical protein
MTASETGDGEGALRHLRRAVALGT